MRRAVVKMFRKLPFRVIAFLLVAGWATVVSAATGPAGTGGDSAELNRIRGFVERFVQQLPTMTAADVDRYLTGSYARDQRRLLRNPTVRQARLTRLQGSTGTAVIHVYPYGPARYLASVQGAGWKTIYVVTTDTQGGIRIGGEVEKYMVCTGTPAPALEPLCR